MEDRPTVVGAKSETEVNLVFKKLSIFFLFHFFKLLESWVEGKIFIISPTFLKATQSHLKFFVVVLMNL